MGFTYALDFFSLISRMITVYFAIDLVSFTRYYSYKLTSICAAPKSFFSLSTFRSKGSDSKPRWNFTELAWQVIWIILNGRGVILNMIQKREVGTIQWSIWKIYEMGLCIFSWTHEVFPYDFSLVMVVLIYAAYCSQWSVAYWCSVIVILAVVALFRSFILIYLCDVYQSWTHVRMNQYSQS